MIRRGAAARSALGAGLLAWGVAGCSLFRGETPQQKFLDALNRGHSAEASQVWLQMSPEDRNKFRRGEGLSPAVTPDQAMEAIEKAQAAPEGEGAITIGPNTPGSLLNLPTAAPAPSPPTAADSH